MKTTDLSQIMATAWRFFRITGQTFSECLRKAWANFKLVTAMRTRIVKFWYAKTSGELREAWGTLRADLIPPTTGTDRKRNDTVQTYYDTEKREYRSFKRLNLVEVSN